MPGSAARALAALVLALVGCTSVDKEHVDAALASMTAEGEVASLDETMFSSRVAQSGFWDPEEFLEERYAGVWFLEPYDAKRIPVLFVHGINGTPANFRYLVANLDRKRFQAWVYYYPTGLDMNVVADHLERTMTDLETRYGYRRFAVVAHSMGGLISRGFVQRHYAASHGAEIPLFVSISTPWGGHAAAAAAPASLDVLRDMAPGSDYQKSVLAGALPPGTEHHLVFTFHRKKAWFGESDDQGVSVSSQLAPAAQEHAVRMYGFDDTHMGVLRNPALSRLLNDLLAARFDMDQTGGAHAD